MRVVSTLALTAVLAITARAQDPSLGFAFALENQGLTLVEAAAADTEANLYIGGAIDGADIDFDPATPARPGVDAFSTDLRTDAFVASYGGDGAFRWATSVTATGTSPRSFISDVATDGEQVYAAGFFYGTANFGAGAEMRTAAGECFSDDRCDVFVAAYDTATGAVLWVDVLGGSGARFKGSLPYLAVDGDHVYVAVESFGSLDADPTDGVVEVNSLFAAYDISTGALVWATTFDVGDSNGLSFRNIAADDERVYLTGLVRGSVDFDSGDGTAVLTGTGPAGDTTDPFLASFDAATGAYLWAGTLQEDGMRSRTAHVATDGEQVYVTGYLGRNGEGSIDFDPGSGEDVRIGQDDLFVAAYEASAGTYAWARVMDGQGRPPFDPRAAVDGSRVFVAGDAESYRLDLDPAGGGPVVGEDADAGQSAWYGAYDTFSGAFLDGGGFGGAEGATALAAQGGRLHLPGSFTGEADLDPTSATIVATSPDGRNAFLVSLQYETGVATESTPSGAFGLRVYPNPSSGTATVRLAGTMRQRVVVFDALGRRVADLGEVAGEVALPALSPGVYVVQAEGASATVTVVR